MSIEDISRILFGDEAIATVEPSQIAPGVDFEPDDISPIIEIESGRYGLDSSIVESLTDTESARRADATSWRGARGLMQIADKTGAEIAYDLGEADTYTPESLYDPDTNIRYGVHYLAKNRQRYPDVPEDIKDRLMLTAYHSGPSGADLVYNNYMESGEFRIPRTGRFYDGRKDKYGNPIEGTGTYTADYVESILEKAGPRKTPEQQSDPRIEEIAGILGLGEEQDVQAPEEAVEMEGMPQEQQIVPESQENAMKEAAKTLISSTTGMAAAAAKTPGLIYRVLTLPQNIISDITGIEKIGPIRLKTRPPEWAEKNPISDYYDEAAERYDVIKKKFGAESVPSLVQRKEFAKAGELLAHQVVATAPHAAMIIASGGTAGLAAAGTISASEKAAALSERKDMPESAKTLQAALHGTLEAIWERIGTLGLSKYVKGIFKKAGLQNGKQIMGTTVKRLLSPLLVGLGESGEEVGTQMSQDIVSKLSGENPDLTVEQVVSNAMAVAPAGFAAGAAMVTPGSIISGAVEAAVEREAQKRGQPKPGQQRRETGRTLDDFGMTVDQFNQQDPEKQIEIFDQLRDEEQQRVALQAVELEAKPEEVKPEPAKEPESKRLPFTEQVDALQRDFAEKPTKREVMKKYGIDEAQATRIIQAAYPTEKQARVSRKERRQAVQEGMGETKTLDERIKEKFPEKPTKNQVREAFGISRERAGRIIKEIYPEKPPGAKPQEPKQPEPKAAEEQPEPKAAEEQQEPKAAEEPPAEIPALELVQPEAKETVSKEAFADFKDSYRKANDAEPPSDLEEQLNRQPAAVIRMINFHHTKTTADADTDPLTGLKNRKWGIKKGYLKEDGSIPEEGDPNYKRRAVAIDLDYFKRVNDNHGHKMGDKVLQRTAAILINNMRGKADLIRQGGEEFTAFVLDGVNETDVLKAVNQANRELEKQDFGPKWLTVTFSAGYGESIAEAEKQRNLAKKGGRAQLRVKGEIYEKPVRGAERGQQGVRAADIAGTGIPKAGEGDEGGADRGAEIERQEEEGERASIRDFMEEKIPLPDEEQGEITASIIRDIESAEDRDYDEADMMTPEEKAAMDEYAEERAKEEKEIRTEEKKGQTQAAKHFRAQLNKIAENLDIQGFPLDRGELKQLKDYIAGETSKPLTADIMEAFRSKVQREVVDKMNEAVETAPGESAQPVNYGDEWLNQHGEWDVDGVLRFIQEHEVMSPLKGKKQLPLLERLKRRVEKGDDIAKLKLTRYLNENYVGMTWRLTKEGKVEIYKEAGDIFEGTEAADKRTETQKAIDREKHRRATPQEEGTEGLPMFSEEERISRKTKQEGLELEEPTTEYVTIRNPEQIGHDEESLKIVHGGIKEVRQADRVIQTELKLFEEEDAPEIEGLGKPRESTILKEWRRKRRVDFTGRIIKTVRELAEMFSVYRNPSVETTHLVYVDDNGKILGHNAMSSGFSSSSAAMEYLRDPARSNYRVKDRMRRMGATGYYIIHNHPTGDVTASTPDKQVTANYYKAIKGLKGHIILDHGKFAFLEVLETRDGDYLSGDEYSYNPRSPNYHKRVMGRKEIRYANDVLDWARELSEGGFDNAIIVVDGKNRAVAWYPVKKKTALLPRAVHDRVQESGGANAFIITGDEKAFDFAADATKANRGKTYDRVVDVAMYKKGRFVSAVEEKYFHQSPQHETAKSMELMGRGKKSRLVHEPGAPYGEEDIKRITEVEEIEKAARSIRAKLAHIPNERVQDRALIEAELRRLKAESAEKVRHLIYDYAKKIGLRGVPYNRVDTLLKKTTTIQGFRKAVEVMDATLETREATALRKALEKRLSDIRVRLNRIRSRGRSRLTYESNQALGAILGQIEHSAIKMRVKAALERDNVPLRADIRKNLAGAIGDGLRKIEPIVTRGVFIELADIPAIAADNEFIAHRNNLLKEDVPKSEHEQAVRYIEDRVRNFQRSNVIRRVHEALQGEARIENFEDMVIGLYEARRPSTSELEKALNHFAQNPGDELPDHIIETLRKTYRPSLQSMDLSQLKSLMSSITSIEKAGRKKHQINEDIRRAEISGAASKATADIEAVHGKSENIPKWAQDAKRGKLAQWSKGIKDKAGRYKWGHIRPERIIEWFTGFHPSELKKRTFDLLLRAENRKYRATKKALQTFQEIHKGIDISDAMTRKHMRVDVYMIDEAGVEKSIEVPLTLNQMMFIYANSQNPGNLMHLYGSGIYDPAIEAVTEALPEKYRNAVDAMIDYYDDFQYPRINEAFVREHDIDMLREHRYFPIRNLDTDRARDAVLADIFARMNARRAHIEKGFVKGRVHSGAAFREMDYFRSVVRNIHDVEHYIAFAGDVKDVSDFLRQQSVKDAMEQADETAQREIKDWLNAVAYGRVRAQEGLINTVSEKLRTNYVMSVLGMNVVTTMKQPMALPRGLAQVNKEAALRAIGKFMQNPIAFMREIDEMSPQMEAREKSYERELAEIAEKHSVARALGIEKPTEKIQRWGMAPIGKADKAVASIIWWAKYSDILSDTGSKRLAISKADEVVRKTQSQGGILNLPSVYRAGGLQRAYTAFTGELNQNLNVVWEMGKTWKMKDWKKRSEEIAFYMLIPPMLEYMVAHGFRPPWEDPEEVFRQMVTNLTGGMMFLNNLIDAALIAAGSRIKEARGAKATSRGMIDFVVDMTPTSFEALEDVGRAIAELNPGRAIEAFAKMKGIPYAQAKRTIRGTKKFAETKDPRHLIWSEYMLIDPSKEAAMLQRLHSSRGWRDRLRFKQWYDDLPKNEKERVRERYQKEYGKTWGRDYTQLNRYLAGRGRSYSQKKRSLHDKRARGEILESEFKQQLKDLNKDWREYMAAK